MQRKIAALGLGVALFLQPGDAASVGASAQATAWLRAHAQPQQDELAELKDSNPMAYAIVKTLLMKRSLGLLDPRHPSHSFAAAAPRAEEVPGVEAFAKIGQESGTAVEHHASASAHHDWLNWKPSESVADALAPEEGGSDATAASQAQPMAAPKPPAPKPADAVEVGEKSEDAKVDSPAENSYLKGINLFGEESAKQRKPAHSLASEDSHDYLASFSWDDDKPNAKHQEPKTSEATATVGGVDAVELTVGGADAKVGGSDAEPKAHAPKNALLAWLGGKSKASFLGVDAR